MNVDFLYSVSYSLCHCSGCALYISLCGQVTCHIELPLALSTVLNPDVAV